MADNIYGSYRSAADPRRTDIDRGKAGQSDPSRGYLDPGQRKALEHAVARSVNNATGTPLSQFQRSLAGFARNTQAAQVGRPRTNPPPLPAFDTDITQYAAKPLTLGQDQSSAINGGGYSSGGAASQLPNFTVLTRSISSVAVWGVLFGSTISDNPRSATGGASVSGTLTSITPTDSDPGWLTIATSDAIWVKASFGTWPSVSGYSIESLGNGDTFDGGRAEYASDGMTPPTYTQTFARVVLAQATQSASALTSFNQQALGSPVMLYSVEAAALTGGGTVKNVLCYMPFF